MSAIVGVFNRNEAPVQLHVLEKMLSVRPERGPDGKGIQIRHQAGLGHQHFWITPEEVGEKQPLADGDVLLACDTRLDNREELAALLNLEREAATQMSDATLILLSYRKWGRNCLSRLLGDYAFLLWDDKEKWLFMARDPLGARDLCYYVDDKICLAASEISQILSHPDVPSRINEEKIASFLAYVFDHSTDTFYEGIFFLPPACGMIVSSEKVSKWRHWNVDASRAIRYRDEQSYADHYLELLREAVRCRLRSTGRVALSMSGGLDSTAIAAVAAPMIAEMDRGNALRTFSYVFDELKSCDERAYIQPMVERYGLEATYIPCDDKWPLRNLTEWPHSRDFVFADPYALLPRAVMKAAQQQGVQVLHGGYYGDTLFGGGLYWAVDMLRERRWKLLAQTIAKNRSLISWRTDLFDFGLRQLVPPWIVDHYRSWRPRVENAKLDGLNPRLVAQTHVKERLAPISKRDQFPSPAQWHRYRGLTINVYSESLAASRHVFNRHGMEHTQPYFDRRLVEFVMAVPADALGRPDLDRRLHRQAMKGLLPEALRMRTNYTVFTPLLMKGLRVKEQNTVRRILADPLIVKRQYIDESWLQKQLDKEYDSSEDSMRLWLALSLELWLQRYWA